MGGESRIKDDWFFSGSSSFVLQSREKKGFFFGVLYRSRDAVQVVVIVLTTTHVKTGHLLLGRFEIVLHWK